MRSLVTAESLAQNAAKSKKTNRNCKDHVAMGSQETQHNTNTSVPPPPTPSGPAHLPLKSQSTVHRKNTVITSACFDTQNLQECEFENETMELEFKGLEEMDDVMPHKTNYLTPIQRKRTNTSTSLKIDCSYEL